jgi:hypothetical protein
VRGAVECALWRLGPQRSSNFFASTTLCRDSKNVNLRGREVRIADLGYLRKRYPTQTEGSDAFPRQPATFGAELRRVAPLLRTRGVSVIHSRAGKDRRRVIELKLA